jgi:hypothetical protein
MELALLQPLDEKIVAGTGDQKRRDHAIEVIMFRDERGTPSPSFKLENLVGLWCEHRHGGTLLASPTTYQQNPAPHPVPAGNPPFLPDVMVNKVLITPKMVNIKGYLSMRSNGRTRKWSHRGISVRKWT